MSVSTQADSDAPALSVLIVTHGNPELTLQCLRSVYDETADLPLEVIVVDSKSPDDTPDAVAKAFPQVRLFAMEENVGFARANNIAAAAATSDWLLLLNPDTVVQDRALERLLAFAEQHPSHGLYGGRTLSGTGNLDPRSCWGRITPWSAFCFASGLSTLFPDHRWFDPESLGGWRRDSVREVDVISGCLLLVRRSLWEQLGGFDERYWMYGEDADLCARARRAGARPVVTPDATITHLVGASSDSAGAKTVQLMRAKATLIRTHWRPRLRPVGIALLEIGVGMRALVFSVSGAGNRSGAKATFWREAWRQRRGWRAGYAAS